MGWISNCKKTQAKSRFICRDAAIALSNLESGKPLGMWRFLHLNMHEKTYMWQGCSIWLLQVQFAIYFTEQGFRIYFIQPQYIFTLLCLSHVSIVYICLVVKQPYCLPFCGKPNTNILMHMRAFMSHAASFIQSWPVFRASSLPS